VTSRGELLQSFDDDEVAVREPAKQGISKNPVRLSPRESEEQAQRIIALTRCDRASPVRRSYLGTLEN
jgi:hypothetical protein